MDKKNEEKNYLLGKNSYYTILDLISNLPIEDKLSLAVDVNWMILREHILLKKKNSPSLFTSDSE